MRRVWRTRGSIHRTISGYRIFYAVFGPEGAEPIFLLHGFPSSSYDFHRVIPILSERYRVIVHDHLGFGLSAKPVAHSYSLLEQAEVAISLYRELGLSRGHLVAHDYGTSVATELCARRERGLCPIDFTSLVLSNGSVHIELAELTPSQRLLQRPTLGPIFARLSVKAIFLAQLRRILGHPRAMSDADLDAMWEGLTRDDGLARLPAISSYIEERSRFRERWIGALERLDLPTLVLWGDRDPVAVPAIAEALAREIPDAELRYLPGIGHYPMLEDPERWARELLSFLEARSAKRP